MKFLVSLSVILIVCQEIKADLPDYLKPYVCVEDTIRPYSECLRKGFEATHPYFIRGIPELDVPPLDPFTLDYLKKVINLGLLSIEVELRNVVATGYKSRILQYIMGDCVRHVGEATILFPISTLKSDYTITIKSLGNSLNTMKGSMDAKFTNLTTKLRGSLKQIKVNGLEYNQVGQLSYSISVVNGHLKLTSDNTVGQLISRVVQNLYNANPRLAARILSPILLAVSRQDVKKAMDKTLMHATRVQWIPPKQQ